MKRLAIILLSISFFTFQSCSKDETQTSQSNVKKAEDDDGGSVDVEVTFGSGPFCWLPGICDIDIHIEWGIASNDSDGNLKLEFTGEALAQKPNADMVIDNYQAGEGFQVDEPYDIDPTLAQDLELTDVHIEAGNYPMTYDAETDLYTVIF